MNEKPSVDPAFTFAVALAVSLVLWWPTMQNTMRGDLDITDAGIRYFLALCDTLNFTRASERCNVSQPALTRAIRNLEDKLGGPPALMAGLAR